jgi:glycosyltransferase involved in cell wall biosynthesis
MAIFLCTFASSDEKNAAHVLRQSALHVAGIDHVTIFDENHPLVKALNTKAADKFQFEWKFWKPYLIHFTLHNVQDDDIVLYCDPTVQFTDSIQSHVQLLGQGKDMLLVREPNYAKRNHRQKKFCKQDCFDLMKCNSDTYKNMYQIDSSLQMYRKSPATMQFLQHYVEFCSQVEILDDVYRSPNGPDFVTHNHEQSVLTNLYTKHAKSIVLTRSPVRGFTDKDKDPAKKNLDPCLEPLAPDTVSPVHKTIVITPTVGTSYLTRCIESVQRQSLLGVEHLIVVDGHEYADKVHDMVEPYRSKNPIHVMVLPFNTGSGGWLGHRIYASMSFLLDCDFVSYLDEDNFYHENHLRNMQELMLRENLDWSFSLRKIVDTSGKFLCNDNCESLGNMSHTILAWDDFLVDTSCFLFKKDVALAVAPHNMHQSRTGDIESDRAITRFLLQHPSFKGKGVAQHTLHYTAARVEGKSVTGDFFMKGNDVFKYDFANKPTLYMFHFNIVKTQEFLLSMYKNDRSYALDEWCMTLLRGLCDKYNLVNGYAVEDMIAPGSLVYVSLCHSHEMPQKVLKRRDVHRIAYTLESPNIRHQQQWDTGFLKSHFDHVLTYWQPLLQDESFASFCPHNTHHLDFTNPKDMALLHTPSKPVTNKSVVIVLERRDLEGDYTINDIPLKCLDKLRSHYVKDLTDITAYGLGWGNYRDNPNLKVGHTFHRSLDTKKAVDYYKDFTFVLIVENTDADGYVSEKIYDAFIAGTIPLYYGNSNSLVGIPSDMYVDLKKFQKSNELQECLDSLSLKEVEKIRNTILKKREQVLRTVSTKAFAETLDQVCQKLLAAK